MSLERRWRVLAPHLESRSTAYGASSVVVILCQAQRPKGPGELLASQAPPAPAKLRTLRTRSQKPALE